MGMNRCGCSLKSRSLFVGTASLVISVMVFFFGLKEMIFESQLFDPRIQTDIIVVSVVATIFSIVLLAGIVKESRHLFLPWLFAFAIAISILFLYSLYLIIFCFHTDIYLGAILFVAAVFCYYGWISIAAFYSQLKDRELDEEFERRYSQDVRSEVFMRPPPPPYSITYENPLAYEKPPPYDAERSASEENRY